MSSQNTLPLSEAMFAGITQHSIQILIYFMFSLIIFVLIVIFTIEFTLCR